MSYNHAYDFAVEIISECEDATDVTALMLREALIEKVNKLSDKELLQSCQCFDTHKE